MNSTELVHLLSSHPELPICIRLDGFAWQDDPRDGPWGTPGWLDHEKRLSGRQALSAKDVVATWDRETKQVVLEITVRMEVHTGVDRYEEPSAAVTMIGEDRVAANPRPKF